MIQIALCEMRDVNWGKKGFQTFDLLILYKETGTGRRYGWVLRIHTWFSNRQGRCLFQDLQGNRLYEWHEHKHTGMAHGMKFISCGWGMDFAEPRTQSNQGRQKSTRLWNVLFSSHANGFKGKNIIKKTRRFTIEWW